MVKLSFGDGGGSCEGRVPSEVKVVQAEGRGRGVDVGCETAKRSEAAVRLFMKLRCCDRRCRVVWRKEADPPIAMADQEIGRRSR